MLIVPGSEVLALGLDNGARPSGCIDGESLSSRGSRFAPTAAVTERRHLRRLGLQSVIF